MLKSFFVISLSVFLSLTALNNAAPASAPSPSEQPNFVLFMVDDQNMDSFTEEVMPKTFKHLMQPGTNAMNGLAAPPLCCPARAGWQTGQYPHNHGVTTNNYELLQDKGNIISTWLDDAGYHTGFVGKYMNEYERTPSGGVDPAPGYDEWWGMVGKPNFYDYTISINGRTRHYGHRDKNHLTTAINRESVRFLSEASDSEDPFFLWISHYAPHFRNSHQGYCDKKSPLPSPQDLTKNGQIKSAALRNAPLPKAANFNESNVQDKSQEINSLPSINSKTQKQIKKSWRCTLASMQGVDRSVKDVIQTLKRTGEYDNTVFVYLSDNGYYFGQHRIPKGKTRPYEEAFHVPLAMHVPEQVLGAEAPAKIYPPVANIDLAPTFLDLADVQSQRVMDGRSLVPLLQGDSSSFTNRAVMAEVGGGPCNEYDALRTRTRMYVKYYEHGTCNVIGRELYDLKSDPNQLRNLLPRPVARAQASVSNNSLGLALEERLDRLNGCNGQAIDGASNPCE